MLKFSFLQCQFFSPSRFPIFTTTFVEFITVIYCAYLWVYFEISLFINSYGMAISSLWFWSLGIYIVFDSAWKF